MRIAAIIPARKGSKRIPKKNLLKIESEYLLEKVLKNLRGMSYDLDIFISTDDEEIKKIAINNQDINVLERGNRFCDDFSSVIDVINWHQESELKNYAVILQIYIHSICIDSKTLDRALKKLIASKKSSLISICPLNCPAEWTFKKKSHSLVPNFKGCENKRSQDLGRSYFDAGQFYIYKNKWFATKDNSFENTDFFEIKRYQATDLDEIDDFELLELNYSFSKQKIKSLA